MTAIGHETIGTEHWVTKNHADGPIRLFAWEKFDPSFEGQFVGTVLLIHGSSMASTPSLDLQMPGHASEHSLMDFLARQGYDVWCFDCEGYARSDKSRDSKFFVSDGADDAAAVAEYIWSLRSRERLLIFGVSSGAIRAERRKRLPQFLAANRRSIDGAFVR